MKWSGLRAFGRVRFFRLAHLPTFAGAAAFALQDSQVVPGTILLTLGSATLFVGIVSLSLGLLAYDVFCPSHIRRFETDYEFYTAQRSALESFQQSIKIRDELNDRLLPAILKAASDVGERRTASSTPPVQSSDKAAEIETYFYGEFSRVFGDRWADIDKKRRLVRLFCATCFSVATLGLVAGLFLVALQSLGFLRS